MTTKGQWLQMNITRVALAPAAAAVRLTVLPVRGSGNYSSGNSSSSSSEKGPKEGANPYRMCSKQQHSGIQCCATAAEVIVAAAASRAAAAGSEAGAGAGAMLQRVCEGAGQCAVVLNRDISWHRCCYCCCSQKISRPITSTGQSLHMPYKAPVTSAVC